MIRGTRYRISIHKDFAASSPKKGLVRFSVGQIYIGTYETTTSDQGLCFHVDDIGDFVFFPPGAIAYEEVIETARDLAKKAAMQQRELHLEDPREWAQRLAEDVADGDD